MDWICVMTIPPDDPAMPYEMWAELVVGILRAEGPMCKADLARRIGCMHENLSMHMRTMAHRGLIEPGPLGISDKGQAVRTWKATS